MSCLIHSHPHPIRVFLRLPVLPVLTHQSAFSYHMAVDNPANTCFLWNTWSRLTSSFLAANALSWGSVSYSEKSTICPFPHTWAHRLPRLFTVTSSPAFLSSHLRLFLILPKRGTALNLLKNDLSQSLCKKVAHFLNSCVTFTFWTLWYRSCQIHNSQDIHVVLKALKK